jgi:hypothetical protein
MPEFNPKAPENPALWQENYSRGIGLRYGEREVEGPYCRRRCRALDDSPTKPRR